MCFERGGGRRSDPLIDMDAGWFVGVAVLAFGAAYVALGVWIGRKRGRERRAPAAAVSLYHLTFFLLFLGR